MLATSPVALIRRPRTYLQRAAGLSPVRGVALVVLTAAVSFLLNLAGARLEPAGLQGAAIVVALALPVVQIAYWLFSATAIDAAARGGMGAMPSRRRLLAATARVVPVLALYPLITLLQAVAAHAGMGGIADILGWLALPLLVWFVVLETLAIAAVYELNWFSALSLALLPYAAVTFLLLVVVVVISGLHVAGVV